MKKIDVGQTISILANVGVIAGIAFLAIELQQNTQVLESQMRFSQSERETEVMEEFLRNELLIDAYIKFENGEQLSRREDLALSAFAQRVFRSVQWVWAEFEAGSFPSDPVTRFRPAFRFGPTMDKQSSLYPHYWGRYDKSQLDPAFVEWMETHISAE